MYCSGRDLVVYPICLECYYRTETGYGALHREYVFIMYPYEELQELRKSGQIDRAYERGSALLHSYANDLGLKIEFGHVLYAKAQQIIANNGQQDDIDNLLQEFTQLGLPREDRLYSKIICECVTLDPVPSSLPQFVMFAGFEAFRREDFAAPLASEYKKRHRSLVEKTASALGKLVSSSDNYTPDVQQFAVEFLDMALEKAQLSYNNLLQYHKALLLGRLGNIEVACSTMKSFVKSKIDEHWTWHALARLEASRDIARALALCVRAYLLCQQEQYIVQLLSDIRLLSENIERFDYARWAGDKEFDIRLAKGWKIFPPLSEIESAPWYATAKKVRNLDGQFQELAVSAEEYVFAGDWIEGNAVGTFEAKSGTHMLKVWIADGENELVTPLSVNPEIASEPVGSPVQVALTDLGRYPKVLRLKPRPNGQMFDCLLEIYGVVDHQNVPRALASIYVTPYEHCLLPYRRFSDIASLKPGSPLQMRCSRWKDRLYAYEVTQAKWEETESIAQFRGLIRRYERGFGFVGEVFIPPPLLPSNPKIEAVSGICILKPKWKGADDIGWTALTVVPEYEGEQADYAEH